MSTASAHDWRPRWPRHQPRALLALVITVGTVVASYQAVQQDDWATVVVLCALALCSVAVPLADAALSRASEYAADVHAAQTGYHAGLAVALRTAISDYATARWWFLRDHPPIRERLQRLGRPTVGTSR